ncbi:hypothetical protein GCM10007989_31110 [Devosia pacifica]|uniref:HPt domain-containing protein n=1 Tax=Devosia pacifica TaxID=1335967 RepID=A0A918SC39_9HYPH|nr:Hpt domain-containing protein [Devosia pacifica]GHA32762.1 hypothetical protein GCM10007989_31110 [Devosia pacifica]
MSTVEALQGSVSPLRDKFAQRMRHDAAELETLLCDPSVSDSEKHERIRFLAHRLAGSASIFGFAVVADPAAEIEDAINQNASASSVELLTRRLIVLIERALADFG